MTMKHGMVLFRRTKAGLSVSPQDINNTTINGNAIVEPWKDGNEIRFLFIGGTWAAGTDFTAKVQVQQRSDDAWVQLQNLASVDVEFRQADLEDATAGENGVLSGTLDSTYIDAETYKAVRLVVVNSNAGSALACVTHEIGGLYVMVPGGNEVLDHMFNLQKNL